MNKNYRLNLLYVEITRRCNKKCEHCLRGDAQDITITESLIDRIFEGTADIQRIVFGGGEPLLEIDKIEYFIRKLLDSTWTTTMLEVTTNGTICDTRITDVFEKFCLSGNNRSVSFRISNDQFHDREEYERAFAFYSPWVDKINEQLLRERKMGRVALTYTQPSGELDHITYGGRGAEYVDTHTDKFHNVNVTHAEDIPHRIKIINNTIPCALAITANGDVVFEPELSYAKEDELSLGNITSQNLSSLIDQHNENCLVLCSETEALRTIRLQKYIDRDWAYKERVKVVGIIIEQIVKLRYLAKKRFGSLPAEVIIENLPFPTPKVISKMIEEIYPHTEFYTDTLLENIEKYAWTKKHEHYVAAMCNAVSFYLSNRNIKRKYPFWLFGNDEDIQEYLERRFCQLHEYYKCNPDECKNDKVFPCDVGEGDIIDYGQEAESNPWEYYQEQYDGQALDIAFQQLQSIKEKYADKFNEMMAQIDISDFARKEFTNLPPELRDQCTPEMFEELFREIMKM